MYQKLVIVGRLGRGWRCGICRTAMAVTSMNVATDRRWTDKNTGQPVEETTWFRVSVWVAKESVNQYLSKGRMVLSKAIYGRIRKRAALDLYTQCQTARRGRP